MQSETSTQDRGVPSRTVKMSFLLKLTLVRVKNKGALLLLAWNFLAFSVFHLMNDYFDNRYMIRAYFAIWGITSSIVGWLADTRIGRYKVVSTSIGIMWIAAVIETTSYNNVLMIIV